MIPLPSCHPRSKAVKEATPAPTYPDPSPTSPGRKMSSLGGGGKAKGVKGAHSTLTPPIITVPGGGGGGWGVTEEGELSV